MVHDGKGDQLPERRRPYSSPTLVDYGTVAKLTQGSGGLLADGLVLLAMMGLCL